MLDAFEIRLADLLADALAGTQRLGPVGRVGVVADPTAGNVGIAVRIASARPRVLVGDDSRERIGPRGDIRLRPLLSLEGEAAVVLTAVPPGGNQRRQGRARLMAMLDQVLLVLHPEDMRQGRAFLADTDLGFELDGFRLHAVGPVPDIEDSTLQIELLYAYSGRFWPVETPAEGGLIETLATRLTVMPVRLPERISAQAGGPDVTVPVTLDLRAAGGAAAALVARLGGAAPPGELVGDGAIEVPAGYSGFAIGADGTASVIYRPPGALAGPAQVRVETRLAHPDRPSIHLADFAIEVVPA